MKVRYQEELPACQGSHTWVSSGEGEKENLWTHLLGLSIRRRIFPLLSLLPPSTMLCYGEAKSQKGVWGKLDSFQLCYFLAV